MTFCVLRSISWADQELYELLRMYFSDECVALPEQGAVGSEGAVAVKGEVSGRNCLLHFGERCAEGCVDCDESEILEYRRRVKDVLKHLLFGFIKELVPVQSWGMLTGIKPVMLMRRAVSRLGEAAALDYMRSEYEISPDKLAIVAETERVQRPFIYGDRALMLYVHIPICPTKCLYCSFPSDTVAHCRKQLPLYGEALVRDFAAADPILARRPLEAVYIGGGTPTALPDAQFSELMELTANRLTADVREFTVEAGRPDTITAEKLRMMRRAKVTRISVNPQSMNDSTLALIGRSHSSAEFREAFAMARREGFDNINTDVIAGLPGEAPEAFRRTMQALIDMRPEGLTVHTLAVKRASILHENRERYPLPSVEQTEEMLAIAYELLRAAGYIPYYMYRQKNMVGNLENVGFSLPGYENLYNIRMMEELSSIVGVGAGAMSKALIPNGTVGDNNMPGVRVERHANARDLKTYLEGTGRYLEGRARLFEELL